MHQQVEIGRIQLLESNSWGYWARSIIFTFPFFFLIEFILVTGDGEARKVEEIHSVITVMSISLLDHICFCLVILGSMFGYCCKKLSKNYHMPTCLIKLSSVNAVFVKSYSICTCGPVMGTLVMIFVSVTNTDVALTEYNNYLLKHFMRICGS